MAVESFIRDIDHYLHEEPLDAQQGLLRYRVGKFLRRNRRAVLATAFIFVLIISLISFFMWRLAEERDHAEAETARTRHIQQFMLSFMNNGDSAMRARM